MSALTGEQLIALAAAIIEADPGPDPAKARAVAKKLRDGSIDKPEPTRC